MSSWGVSAFGIVFVASVYVVEYLSMINFQGWKKVRGPNNIFFHDCFDHCCQYWCFFGCVDWIKL